MEVKIDTREKFYAITIKERVLAANMTADMDKYLLPLLQNDVKSVVLILKDTEIIDKAAAEYLLKTQEAFYENSASFVVCELKLPVENSLDQLGLLELLNAAPTESEASDIVQMEEIERELLDEEE
jgi:anti-anti-sigma regulatory factor